MFQNNINVVIVVEVAIETQNIRMPIHPTRVNQDWEHWVAAKFTPNDFGSQSPVLENAQLWHLVSPVSSWSLVQPPFPSPTLSQYKQYQIYQTQGTAQHQSLLCTIVAYTAVSF